MKQIRAIVAFVLLFPLISCSTTSNGISSYYLVQSRKVADTYDRKSVLMDVLMKEDSVTSGNKRSIYAFRYLKSNGDIISINYINRGKDPDVGDGFEHSGIVGNSTHQSLKISENSINYDLGQLYTRSIGDINVYLKETGQKDCNLSIILINNDESKSRYKIPSAWSFLCSVSAKKKFELIYNAGNGDLLEKTIYP